MSNVMNNAVKHFHYLLILFILILGVVFVLKVGLPKQEGLSMPTENEVVLDEKNVFVAYREKKDLLQYKVLQKRDLFQDSLRRIDIREDALKFKDVFKKNYQCLGVVLDSRSVVIVEDKRKRKSLFLSVGDQVDGFFIKEINEDRIILEKQHQQIEVLL